MEPIQGLTKPAITRLARQAGIKRIENSFYDDVRDLTKDLLTKIIGASLLYTEISKRKIVSTNDVLNGIKSATGGQVAISLGKSLPKGHIDFRTYLTKIRKMVYSDAGITQKASNELNSVVYYIGEAIATQAKSLAKFTDKKTIGVDHIRTSAELVFLGCDSWLTKIVTEKATKALETYLGSTKGNMTARSGLLLAPARVKRYFQKSNKKFKRLGSGAVVYLAGILEALAKEILDLAGNAARDNKKVQITVRHLFLALENDEDFGTLMRTQKITLIGSGVLPNIHAALLPQKKKDDAKKESSGPKKPFRFSPGTVALRQIRRYQKTSGELMFRKAPFRAITKEVATKHIPGIKFSEKGALLVQAYIEALLVDVMHQAGLMGIHASRGTATSKDLKMVRSIRKI